MPPTKGLREEEKMHTPLPWHNKGVEIFDSKRRFVAAAEDQDGGWTTSQAVADEKGLPLEEFNITDQAEKEANAAFIVRAVNSFDELLALVKVLQGELLEANEANGQLLDRVDAAIAKAEGR